MNLTKTSMFKSVFLFLSFYLIVIIVTAQVSSFIHTDQFGYHVNADKVAVLSNPVTGYNAALSYSPPTAIQLRDATTDLVVFTANISIWNSGNTHSQSGDKGWWYDFSSFKTPGSFYVYDPVNNQKSAVFEINNYPYGDVLKAAGRAFYYNRCNTPKLPAHAGTQWSHATSFLNPLQDASCRYIHDKFNVALEKDLSGGWFDAGDYNKYVTFTYTTLHDLLYAYEESPDVFGDDWNIPESGNGIPDLIDEIKWELDWLIKMTNPDGSVQIKMGSQNYSENISSPPSANIHQRFYGPTCTSASATVASVFAHASIIFAGFPEFSAFSANLHEIAESTFLYTLPHYTNNTFETNCDNGEIVSGDADKSAQEQKDMMISAAVYLFEKTGNNTFNTFVTNNYTQSRPWATNFWGPYDIPLQDALLRYTTLPGASVIVSNNIINMASTEANNNWNGFYGWSTNDLYRAFMPDWSYHWGSNTTKACYGNLNNRLADLGISNVSSLRKKATELLHYFHGVNPQGIVYLSNMYSFGADRSANEIYHSWFNDGTNFDNALTSLYGPAPGFLTGGANKDFSVSNIVPPAGQPAQKSYKDWNTGWPQNSWEITEPAIYCQASYLRLLARVIQSSLQTHQITLSTGWSGLSSYIMPVNKGIADVFTQVDNAFVIAQTMSGVYYPAGPVNTIGDWFGQSAYKVKMGNQADLTIFGNEELNKTFALSSGWNLMPVICNTNVSTSTLVSGLGGNLVVIKEIAGSKLYWPAFGIYTLSQLTPGKAYYVRMTAADSVTFPANVADNGFIPDEPIRELTTLWNEIHRTAGSHIFAIQAEALTNLSQDDIIGIFTPDGICAGNLQIGNTSENHAFYAFADDQVTSEPDGFTDGQPMIIKLFRSSTGEEFNLEANYNTSMPNYDGLFATEGISAVKGLSILNTGLTENFAKGLYIYPNPTNGNVTIGGIAGIEQILVMASDGSVVMHMNPNADGHQVLDLSALPAGFYQVQIRTSEGVVTRKVVKGL